MLKQAIDLPGVGNARELGGYAVQDRHVREGVLLRTAGLNRATPEAIARLHDTFRLQTLVDLRMTFERNNQPDPQVPGATYRPLTIIEMEDFPVPEGLDPSKLDLLNDPSANRMELFELSYEFGMVGPDMYEQFLLGERGKAAYAEFFRELLALEDGRAILWHCTDGKDRTGCAAMLVLCALGADRKTVLADYLLTNDFNAQLIDAALHHFATPQQLAEMPAQKLEVLRVMVGGVSEEYLANAMDVLEERYGSVGAYLRDELDVGEAELKQLRAILLA